MMDKQLLVDDLRKHGQEHVVQFWDELTDNEREHLYEDIKHSELDELANYYERVKADLNQTVKELDSAMQPVPDELKGSVSHSSREQLRRYESQGLRAIAQNEVAVLLLAGGQGTRLGVSYPKGMYSVKLPSGKTLYQIQAERLIRVKELAEREFPQEAAAHAGRSITWYIMTSEHTQESTQEFFRENDYFGLDKDSIILFEQYMLPCLTMEGKIIMDQKHKISKAPDGNGGLYKALRKRRILDDMQKRGIKYVHIYGVDNILVKIADPTFVGFCIDKQANCAAKVVKKVDPEEKVGVICKVHDRFQVVEYSEISQVTRNLREPNGELTYNAGSICNHFLTVSFLNELCTNHEYELKHHIAEKKIPYVDERGVRQNPSAINGIKLEKFVFDVFPFSTNFAIWEVLRDEEFSPLKNGEDSKKETPTTCRNDLLNLQRRWLDKAGAVVIDATDDENAHIEISPLVSYSGEGLDELVGGKRLAKPLVIELDKATKTVKFNGLDANAYHEATAASSASS